MRKVFTTYLRMCIYSITLWDKNQVQFVLVALAPSGCWTVAVISSCTEHPDRTMAENTKKTPFSDNRNVIVPAVLRTLT